MTRRHRWLAVPLVSIVGLADALNLGSLPAHADGDDGKLLLVLDSSGSMKEPAGDGKTKIEAAKAALNTVVDALDANAEVGMRVYGATVFDKSKPGACRDSQRVVDIGTDNRPALKSAIAKYNPYGETPISYSLEQAGRDVGTSGQRTILLVSDGEETCVPNPCPIAAKLAAQGIDLRIDVIGLGVSGKARSQLQCIADKGNGEYHDADSTEDLTRQLNRATERAIRPFELSGTPVTGAAESADAPEITDGRWTDKLPATPEETKHYRLKRTMPGSTFWVGTAAQPKDTDTVGSTFTADINDANDETCGKGYFYGFDAKAGGSSLVSGQVVSIREFGEASEACQNGDLDLAVNLDPIATDLAKTPVQFIVYEEPPISGDAPAAAGEPTWTGLGSSAKHGKVEGGTSFTNAPLLERGRHTIGVVPGEVQLFRVRADWGQSVQAVASVGTLPSSWKRPSAVTLDLISPLGGRVTSLRVAGQPAGNATIVQKGAKAAVATSRISYGNRFESRDAVQATSLPGDYYVAVSLAPNPEHPKIEVPLILQVAAVGQAGQGKPNYQRQQAPASPSAEPSATPSDQPSEVEPSTPVSEPPSTAPTTEPETASSGRPWGLIAGLGIGAVALTGIGVLAGRALRRPRT